MMAALSVISLPLLLGGLGTLLIEYLLRPQPLSPWRRGIAPGLIHLGSWLLLFGLFTLFLQRPWFAVVFILSLQLVIVQSSNTKSRTLNEPFICHDFEYFWDAIKHPRLYVPFFGIGLAIAASSAGAVAIGAFLFWEPSLMTQTGVTHFITLTLSIAITGALILAGTWRALPPPSLAPRQDMHQLGLFSSLWAYGIALFSAPSTPPLSPFTQRLNRQGQAADSQLPNVVMVQSESFMDPRAWCAEINPQLLPHFDATCQQAVQRGQLKVPAWGANTVRTEAAVLTGIAPEAWGACQFNPYRRLARQSVANLVQIFQQAGYRCICVHPYPASFYLRDQVMPKMGFDQFLDIDAFEGADKAGQYIGDAAVARKVGRLLKDDDNRPLFIFTITMENHGPLHLESPSRSTLGETLPAAPWPLSGHQRDLAVYLNHLRQADDMLGSVKRHLQSSTRSGVLCWYGDHVPILPDAYRVYGAPDGTTPYVIWSTQNTLDGESHHSPAASSPLFKEGSQERPELKTALPAEELGIQLFKQVFERGIK
ncbi:LTA synthase family protein [Vreelandella azerica]|uniref:LTA synthase family protein n=1 Tax=Vreelandella azerica TaxID=2732867 RepID=UPI001F4494C7|nr:LTA synthase family protein [Halomonas azerica]